MVRILPDNVNNPFEQDPFPNGYVPNINEDKLFKHVVFHTDKDVSKVRVTAVGHDWTASTESEQKTVELPLDSWNPSKDNVRIKAVLNPPVDGVEESHWVQLRFVGEHEAKKMNQFRVRGVSDQGWKSRWVYSELRNDENDLVAFELLYDLLDVLLYTHEHDLDALLDTAVKDTFTNLLYNQAKKEIGYSYSYDFDDLKKSQFLETLNIKGQGNEMFDFLIGAGISEDSLAEIKKEYFQFIESKRTTIDEISKIVSHLLRKEFRELLHSSPSELFEFSKTYRMLDRYQTSNEDFIYLILEQFLDDRYEKVIEETEFRALLSNDEEMHLLLQSVCEFDVKSELISHAYDLGLDDHFVTVINDAVKLISEPLVYENVNIHSKEETFKFLRMALQEAFVPFLIMEQRLYEINTDLSDETSFDTGDKLIEYSTIHSGDNSSEEYMIRHLFIEEMIEMLINDMDIVNSYHAELVDQIINMVNKEKIALFIEYDPIEFIEVFSKISEDFKYEYKTLLNSQDENISTTLNESISSQDLKDSKIISDHKSAKLVDKLNQQVLTTKGSATEDIHSVLSDDVNIYELTNDSYHYEMISSGIEEEFEYQSLMNGRSLRDALHSKTQELHIIMSLLEQSYIQDSAHAGLIDETNIQNRASHIHQEIAKRIALQVELLNKDTTLYESKNESKHVEKLAVYDNLYNLNPLDNLLKVYKEFKEQHLDVDRLDDFFEIMWNLKEDVVVYLGDLGGAWPLGQFILGTSTLKGDPNNPNSNQLV